ncbi:hypothetical protein GCM10027059_14210 [Myceligenerans halotolerans]
MPEPEATPSRPSRSPAALAALVLGSFAAVLAPIGLAVMVGFDDRFVPVWLAGAVVVGTVLILLAALGLPRLLLPGVLAFGPLLMIVFTHEEFLELADLTISRRHVGLVAAGIAVWLLLLAWALRAIRRHWIPAGRLIDTSVTGAGRYGQVIALVLVPIALVVGLAATGWQTVWNVANLTAAETAGATVTIVESGTYTYSTGGRGGRRITGVYWIAEDTDGGRWRLERPELTSWEHSTGLTIDDEGRRNSSCTAGETEIEAGDVLTLAGRQGVLGFAVDHVAAIDRDGRTVCG